MWCACLVCGRVKTIFATPACPSSAIANRVAVPLTARIPKYSKVLQRASGCLHRLTDVQGKTMQNMIRQEGIGNYSGGSMSEGQRLLPRKIVDERQIEQCIEACLNCHTTCLKTAMQPCLELGGKHTKAEHFRLMLDCAQICQTTADFLLRGSALSELLCGACAVVCEACAHSCEVTGDMNKCMQVARRCAEACRRLTG